MSIKDLQEQREQLIKDIENEIGTFEDKQRELSIIALKLNRVDHDTKNKISRNSKEFHFAKTR